MMSESVRRSQNLLGASSPAEGERTEHREPLVIRARTGWSGIDLTELWAYRDLFRFLLGLELQSGTFAKPHGGDDGRRLGKLFASSRHRQRPRFDRRRFIVDTERKVERVARADFDNVRGAVPNL